MIWHRHGNSRAGKLLLHYDMTATLAHFDKSMQAKMLQTCAPERMRSLPNRYLYMSHVNLLMKTLLDFLG